MAPQIQGPVSCPLPPPERGPRGRTGRAAAGWRPTCLHPGAPMLPLAPPVLLAGLLLGADPLDWPSLTQEPYQGRAIPDPGLPPLLVTGGGARITTREGWEEARSALLRTWREHLGTPP